MDSVQKAINCFYKNKAIHLEDLKDLVRIPSVSFPGFNPQWVRDAALATAQLLEKRGRLPGKQKFTEAYLREKLKLNIDVFIKEFFECKKTLKDIPGFKPYFKLHPPRGGFERKGIKTPFSLGGVLGYRKEKMNDLVRKML